ncbi:MAG: glycosyl hydrolase [Candidatus Cyclobacteriaceae bacterium M3_2C_046]
MIKSIQNKLLSCSPFVILVFVLGTCTTPTEINDLERSFRNPPAASQALTWWHWINGNVSKEGISKDLEAMKTAGVQGAILFNVGFFPEGEVPFMSDIWWDHMKHAIQEADRLGLKFGIFNSDGWSMSGGPWISAEESMKQLVWTDTVVEGGQKLSITLQQPLRNIIYEDIAVLALPALPAEKPLPVKQVHRQNGHLLTDHNFETSLLLDFPDSQTERILFDLGEVQEIRSAVLHLKKVDRWAEINASLQYSLDGHNFTEINKKLPLGLRYEGFIKSATLSFPLIQARYIQISINKDDDPDPVDLAGIDFYTKPQVGLWEPKSGQTKRISHVKQPQFMKELAETTYEQLPDEWVVNGDELFNITRHLDQKGVLNWDAPAGNWIIKRVGYTSTLRKNAPSSTAGRGFECDKMSASATEKHFNGYLAKVINLSQNTVDRPIDFAQMESWEAGIQNWTQGFDQEFQSRRGYSIIPWLPVLTGGHVINSYEESNRFLWDMRKTVTELFSENYWAVMHRLCREHGVKVLGEGSGKQHYLYDPILYHKQNDIPMGEFWTGAPVPRNDCKNASSVAHTYGKELVAAESFTGGGNDLWRLAPYDMKKIGDQAFSLGVNQFVLHSYVHQPYDIGPGFTLSKYGNHFQRHNPWYIKARGWLDYVARSQYLLRQGDFVADVCYFTGEGIPAYLGLREELIPGIPSGYDYDGVNLELLQQMEVAGGRMVLPSGASYHLMVFRDLEQMTPALITEVERLVKDGATIMAQKPDGSPSLQDFPKADELVKMMADRVWKNLDGSQVKRIRYGKGELVWGIPVEDVLKAKGISPDFTYHSENQQIKINYLHRKLQGKDLYFLASEQPEPVKITASFRSSARFVELWDPDKGIVTPLHVDRVSKENTEIALSFEPLGSMFVLFTDQAARVYAPEIRNKEHLRVIDIAHDWQISFPAINQKIFAEDLFDWTLHNDPAIKYHSGTAIYQNSFELSDLNTKHYILDLGQVEEIATVIVNGQKAGDLWKPPFELNITDYVKAGINEIKIEVTNTAANQLIGDEQLPADLSYKPDGTGRWEFNGEYPDWLREPEIRKSGRKTFVTYKFFDQNSPLESSGLTGPVKIKVYKADESKLNL